MEQQDYKVSISVNATADAAYKAINNVPAWWTVVFEGSAEKAGDTFTVTFGETWITIKVTELIRGIKIAWHVTDCNKHWLQDKKEWKDTSITWDISATGNGSNISFTHIGLRPGMECYNGCEKAWGFYIQQSLLKLLNEGKGQPEQQ